MRMNYRISAVAFLVLAMLSPWTRLAAAPLNPAPPQMAIWFYSEHLKNPSGLRWRQMWLTPELYQALTRERKQVSKEYRLHKPLHLQYDPFTGEKTLPGSFRIVDTDIQATTAVVTMEMTWPAFHKDPTRTVVLKCRKSGKRWQIADIVTSEGSLLGFLTLND